MKRLPLLLGLIVLVGGATYLVCYRFAIGPSVVVTPDGTDAELAWLQREFALTPTHYEKVLALHHAYRPVCADHCARYLAAHDRLKSKLQEQTAWAPEIGEAIAEMARLESECHASMLKYSFNVAACMSPEQGRRYLDMIKLQITKGDPAGMFAATR